MGMTPETASTVSAIAAGISAALTLTTVVIAVLTLRGARADSEAAAERSRQDAAERADRAERERRERIRPVLTPEFERELLTSSGTLNLVIRNWGASPARDVAVTFDPPPPTDLEALPHENMMRWLYQAYERPISLWPSQWRMSNVYRAGYDTVGPLTLTIAYLGPDGHRYADEFHLDPAPLLKTTSSTPSDPTTKDLDERLDAWAKRITRALEALVRTVR